MFPAGDQTFRWAYFLLDIRHIYRSICRLSRREGKSLRQGCISTYLHLPMPANRCPFYWPSLVRSCCWRAPMSQIFSWCVPSRGVARSQSACPWLHKQVFATSMAGRRRQWRYLPRSPSSSTSIWASRVSPRKGMMGPLNAKERAMKTSKLFSRVTAVLSLVVMAIVVVAVSSMPQHEATTKIECP